MYQTKSEFGWTSCNRDFGLRMEQCLLFPSNQDQSIRQAIIYYCGILHNHGGLYLLGVHCKTVPRTSFVVHACIQVYYKNLGHLEQQLSRHNRVYRIMLSAQHAMNSTTLYIYICALTQARRAHAACGQLDKPRADESAKSYKAYTRQSKKVAVTVQFRYLSLLGGASYAIPFLIMSR